MAVYTLPSPLQATSLAAAVGAGVENVQFVPSANNVPHKIAILGLWDEAGHPEISGNLEYIVTDPDDVGARFGWGCMVHRLAIAAYKGSQGVEAHVFPVAATGSPTLSTGDVTVTAIPTESGVFNLYIGGDVVSVALNPLVHVAVSDVATAIEEAINADQNLPVSAIATLGVVDLTAKAGCGGTFGDEIWLGASLGGFQQKMPTGMVVTYTDMTGGAVVFSTGFQGCLAIMGTGDNQNRDNYTEVIHGFGNDGDTALDLLSVYNGEGNVFEGNYAKLVSRPFRSLFGPGSVDMDLAAATTIGDARKNDRTNGLLIIPYANSHPQEIAAQALGIMARVNNDRAAQSYIGQKLDIIYVARNGWFSQKWTDVYTNRDTALKSGVSCILMDGNIPKLQNVMTFYHPDGVPRDSNGYASQRNISILQNLLFNIKLNFSQEKWTGITIVEDTAQVSNATDREKARDTDSVLDDLLALTTAFEGHAWIFSAAWTIEQLQAGGLITIRPGGTGFNITLPVILSGEGGIIDTVVKFDTSLAVFVG